MSSRQPTFSEPPTESISHMPFVDNVEDFTCGICLGVLDKATRACNSNHLFCAQCLETTVEMTHSDNCPNCRQSLIWSESGTSVGSRMVVVDKLISSQYVRCPDGCGEVFALRALNEHRKTCTDREVDCPYKSCGCDHRCKRSDMEEHLKADNHNHLHLFFQNCERDSAAVQFALSQTKQLVRGAYNQNGSVMLARFDCLNDMVRSLEGQVSVMDSKLSALVDSVGILLENSVRSDETTAHPPAKKARNASGKEPEPLPSQAAHAAIARLESFSKQQQRTPPAKKPAVSPLGAPAAPGRNPMVPPLGEGERALLLASNPDQRLPLLEAAQRGAASSFSDPPVDPGSPAYSPTSPRYSPTSPAYSPYMPPGWQAPSATAAVPSFML